MALGLYSRTQAVTGVTSVELKIVKGQVMIEAIGAKNRPFYFKVLTPPIAEATLSEIKAALVSVTMAEQTSGKGRYREVINLTLDGNGNIIEREAYDM